MTPATPRVQAFGERALLIELGDTIDSDVNARVHALASRLDAGEAGLVGLGRAVPAYASLLLPFDPDVVTLEAVQTVVRRLAADSPAAPLRADELVEIAVRYGGEDGPDLEAVAYRIGLSAEAVIELHSASTYRVFMLGFAPGFAYLGPLPERLRLPRRPEPRVRVPAGSVAIAAGQTAVYPHATAGGWHLLGRSSLQLWDPHAESPARLRPGARVRFVPS